MDLRIEGSRTPYSYERPSSRNIYTPYVESRNPITGLKSPAPWTSSAAIDKKAPRPPSTKPDSVPQLDLKFLGNDIDVPGPEISERTSSRMATTVSWGTSRHAPHIHTPKETVIPSVTKDKATVYSPKSKKNAWEGDVVPIDLVPPSARYKALYRKYEEEMKQSYQEHVARNARHQAPNEIREAAAELRDVDTVDVTNSASVRGNLIDSVYCHPQHNDTVVQKKLDAEALVDFKKKEKLVETVMIDQLSRAVISDPEQDERLSHRGHEPGMSRGAIRTMHDSKVSTRSSATENLLSKRVRFGARILSRNNVDSVKELSGFYFHVDQSMTIYEYRQFGKSAKALPFIARGRHGFIRGPLKNKTYELTDIYAGANLEFRTHNQHTLPKRMRDDAVVVFRVTDIDDREKRDILLPGIHPARRDADYVKCHIPQDPAEMERRMTLLQIQKYTRDLLRPRGVKTIIGLLKECGKMDKDDTGHLPRYDLEKITLKYRIDPPSGLLDSVLEMLDYDNSGYLDYGEFLRVVIGEMNEKRKSVVRRAFLKMDHARNGVVSLNDVRKFFCARHLPLIKSGQLSEEEVLMEFIDSFGVEGDQDITYGLFEAYYEGLSIGIDSCDQFISILRNTWGI